MCTSHRIMLYVIAFVLLYIIIYLGSISMKKLRNTCSKYISYPHKEVTVKTIKKTIVSVLVLLIGVMILSACSAINEAKPQNKNELTQKEFINQRIDSYTHQSFRFVESYALTEKDNKYSIEVSLVPEVGSIPIKEDIYRSLAVYAWSVNNFFPEIISYDFTVLWNDKSKEEAIHAKINESGVKSLANNYASILLDQNNKLESSYTTIFTEILVSDIAKEWPDR